MGNFEKAIPANIKRLEADILAKRREIWALEDHYLHNCNCEYCDDCNDELPADIQDEADDLACQIDSIKATINRLKRHAKVHNVRVPK